MSTLSNKVPKLVAVYAASGLGDAVLAAQLARQLREQGHHLTLYSSVLGSMALWFPEVVIKPYPDLSKLDAELKAYDHIIAADYTPVRQFYQSDEKVSILSHSKFDKKQPMLRNLLQQAHRLWDTSLEPLPAFKPPSKLKLREYPQRVILHPTSGAERRNWPAEKFVKLALQLKQNGFSPVITVSINESPDWQWVEDHGVPLKAFSTLDDTAAFYYESGYFVGNDSGGGHLASLLGVPTVTLCARLSYLRLWKPGWAPGIVVAPFISLPGSHLKQRFWKKLLTVGQVIRGLNFLESQVSYGKN